MCTQSTEDIRGMRKIGRQDFLKSELKEAVLKEAELKKDVLKIKEKATNLFKQKKFDEAKDTYLKCDVIDPTDKIYKSNIIACLIELQELNLFIRVYIFFKYIRFIEFSSHICPFIYI